MTVTEVLSRYIQEVDTAALPPEVVAIAREVVLDGLAVTVAGCREPSPRLVGAQVREMGGHPLCTVVGQGFRTSPVQAAYVNGVSCHVLDFEPMWHPPTHPTSPTLPVALALAEWLGLDGATVIAGLVAGFEVQGRIRLATAHLNPGDLTFHPPGIVGVIGAAATAARVLELSPDQTCAALGIAGSRAGGLMANVGSMTKSNHCGNAARLGLEAALLARDGYTAHPDIFAAPRGYADAIFAGRFDHDLLVDGFGHPYRMLDPGLVFKRYPCQIATQFAVEAALALRSRHGVPASDVASVTIETPVMGYVDRPAPATGLEGKSSFQYVTALALLDGEVAIDGFSDMRLHAPDMQALLAQIRLEPHESIPGSLDRMWVVVRATLAGGAQIEARCGELPGLWHGTGEFQEHRSKVETCLGRGLAPADVEHCLAVIGELDRIGPEDLRRLLARVA